MYWSLGNISVNICFKCSNRSR